MKLRLVLSMVILMGLHNAGLSQTGNPDPVNRNTWVVVDSLMRYGFDKTAGIELDRIYQLAKEQNNLDDFVRALLYKAGQSMKQENPTSFLRELQQELKSAKTPRNQILHSVIAGIYYRYYQENRWKINERTGIEDDTTTNILDWGKEDFFNNIRIHFKISLQKTDSLNQYFFADQSMLTDDLPIGETPVSLYDLLAFRAIRCFSELGTEMEESPESLPAKRKNIFLAPLEDFLNFKFIPPVYTDFRLQALQLYQSVLKLHFQKQDTLALIQTDFRRIVYVKNAFYPAEKYDTEYLETLKNLAGKYESNAAVAQINYEIARTYVNRGNNYDPYLRKNYQWEIKKGLEFAEAAIQKFPDSPAASDCIKLVETIKRPQIELVINSVNLPDQPIISSLSYRNLDRVYLKLIPLDYLKSKNENKRLSIGEILKNILSKPVFDERKQNLPDEGDYQMHNAQLLLPDLPVGYYALVVSSSAEFDSLSTIHLNYFWASGIGFVSRDDQNGAKDIFVLNRETGNPLGDVKLEVQSSVYDPVKNNEFWETEKVMVSGKNGYLRLTGLGSRKPLRFIFSRKTDTLVEEGIFNRPPIDLNAGTELHTTFFTDRSIYRPGQTIYFKGIVYQNKNGHFEVVPGHKTKIELFDANHQLIKSVDLKTNEFGSFSGSFQIPQNNLGGRFLIGNETGSTIILSEEYKRPGFEIVFDTAETQYRLNDTVTVSGKVKAYSSYPLSEARVKFNVKRFAYRIYNDRNSFYNPSEQQIGYGELKTDDEGRFLFKFFASASEDIIEKQNPVFDFNIEVAATDASGETQSANMDLHLGRANLLILPDLPDKLDMNKTKLIPVTITDLNSHPRSVNYVAGIYKYKSPDKAFKNRKWVRPDRFLLDKETFYTYFENEQYDDEKNFEGLEQEYQAFQAELNTTETPGIEINDIKDWPMGIYKLRIKAEDQFDEEVVFEKYFVLYNSKSAQLPYPEIDWFVLDKSIVEVNDSLSFLIGSACENVPVHYEIQQDNRVLLSKWLTLKNEQRKIDIPIEKMSGKNFDLNLFFVNNNAVYEHREKIKLIDPSKQLNLKIETFRPVIQPGSKETWKIKIAGKGKEKPMSELLIGMIDASLDQIMPHHWQFKLPDHSFNRISWNTYQGFGLDFGQARNNFYQAGYFPQQNSFLPSFKWDFISPFYPETRILKSLQGRVLGVEMKKEIEDEAIFNVVQPAGNSFSEEISVRKNFSETAFFYPNLKTDENGDVIFKFTSPESLTRWKLMAVGHTKDLRIASLEQDIVSRKNLMVTPNVPRFLRSGDTIYFRARITNQSAKLMEGETTLKIIDAGTSKPVAGIIADEAGKPFSVPSGSSVVKQWKLIVPKGLNAVKYILTAVSDHFSDGEERLLPVLENKLLVTESMPFCLDPLQEKKMVFTDLLESANRKSLVSYNLKFEAVTSPAWYAILALPYIAEGEREDALSLYNRFYANAMAGFLLHSQPRIKQIFSAWQIGTPEVFTSELQKNKELKSVLLEETPWLLDAKNESEQRKSLIQFFDENQVNHKLTDNLNELLKIQLGDGSWPWFKGMYGNRFVTLQIVNGLVQLMNRNVLGKDLLTQIEIPLKNAVRYLNRQLTDDYQFLKNNNKLRFESAYLNNNQIRYLFTLSNLNSFVEQDEKLKSAIAYYLTEEQRFWMEKTNDMQGMIALTLFCNGDTETAGLILKSLKERAVLDKEQGAYWENIGDDYFETDPITTQALLIEVFSEIGNNKSFVNELKKWLILQKQTRMWRNASASVEAVNAILTGKPEILSTRVPLTVKVGNIKIGTGKQEPGTGFYEHRWRGQEIVPGMGNIQLKNENNQMAWGALHWQYFEQLDSVKSFDGPIKIEKRLFVKEPDQDGSRLIPVGAQRKIRVGDLVVSRIIVRLDRDMEFVHLNDMRAPALEPAQNLSTYKTQGGVGFYQKISDLATHYYFDILRKGSYVFEYEMFATQKGTFSEGVARIQCEYAPGFSGHSEGMRIEVVK